MKQITKQLTALAVVCIMIFYAFAVPVQADAKNTYWLSGISKMADGSMRMYYKNKNTIVIKGKQKKASTQSRLEDAAEKKGTYSLKAAANCKVIQIEAEKNEVFDYAEWVENMEFQNGDEIPFICASCKVKNKKIVKIYFSA